MGDVKVDVLDRQPFVNKVLNIIEKLSENKKNACYAINGKWGVGKSFVLEMIEKQIKEIQQNGDISNKYFLFHYDCWKYDFYEEPIIAIIASMMDEIDKDVNILFTEKFEKMKGIFKAVGSSLLLKFNDIIKKETNIDIDEISNIIRNGMESAQEKIKEIQEYDTFFSFKKILVCFQEAIFHLSENQTVILVVDELDRCLPEYMIKVLERLHHVFYGVPNVQVILSIDKEQIKHTVKHIYGEDTEVDRYLAKFINFEINLDVGSLNEEFENKYTYYFSKFQYKNKSTDMYDVQDFQTHILDGIDMRSRIEIINKCDLLHDILCAEEQADFSIMCIEMFLIRYELHDCCFGFRKGKSIYDNAFQHTNKDCVLNFDLKDFFPSIKQEAIFYSKGIRKRNLLL